MCEHALFLCPLEVRANFTIIPFIVSNEKKNRVTHSVHTQQIAHKKKGR